MSPHVRALGQGHDHENDLSSDPLWTSRSCLIEVLALGHNGGRSIAECPSFNERQVLCRRLPQLLTVTRRQRVTQWPTEDQTRDRGAARHCGKISSIDNQLTFLEWLMNPYPVRSLPRIEPRPPDYANCQASTKSQREHCMHEGRTCPRDREHWEANRR